MGRRILIVGGGYAGAMCAVRMARRTPADVEIVVAEPRPFFVERVRLHERAAGGGRARRSFASLFAGTRVQHRLATVAGIALEQRRVFFERTAGATVAASATRTEASEGFDELILATGSVGGGRDVPGIEHAWSCATEEHAVALRERLARDRGAAVVIVGGGLTGIELATELGSRDGARRITLVTNGELAPELSARARLHVRRALEAARVELREHSAVAAVERDGVVLGSGDVLPSDVTVWCGGMVAAPLARRSGLAVDELGRAEVDGRLRSTSHGFVRVIGDAARVAIAGPGGGPQPLRMACATALPQAAFCADDLARELRGLPRPGLSFAYAAQCISLGRRDGVIQQVDPFDASTRRWIAGRGAAWLKEMICRYPLIAVRLETRGIGYRWPKAPPLAGGRSAELPRAGAPDHLTAGLS